MRRKFTEIVEFSGKACPNFDGKKNYISTGCVHEDHICKNEIEVVDYRSKPSRANLVVRPGDILFAKMQATKKTLLVDEDLSQNIYSTGFYAIKPKDGLITKKCLFYLISSSLFLDEKDKNCSGATQKAINNQGLSNIELNIPEFSMQESLTQKLDVLSIIIEAKQSQIEYLDNLVKARFVEMFGNILTNKDLPLVQLSELADIGSSKRIYANEYVGEGIPFYRSKEIRELGSGLKPSVELFISPERYNEIKTKYGIPKVGDILIAAIGATIGYSWIVNTECPFYYKDGNLLILSIKEGVNPIFLNHAMGILIEDFKNKGVAGSAQLALTIEKLEKMMVVNPDINEQNHFAEFVKQVDKSKFAVQKSLEKTQLLFDGLMQEYFG